VTKHGVTFDYLWGGVAVFRTDDILDPSSWKAWGGTTDFVISSSPSDPTLICAPSSTKVPLPGSGLFDVTTADPCVPGGVSNPAAHIPGRCRNATSGT
jgi:hypothetical protein